MSYEDAMKRLAGCRAAQPHELQVIVGAEIVDALIAAHSAALDALESCLGPLTRTQVLGMLGAAQPLRTGDGSSFSGARSGPQNACPGRDDGGPCLPRFPVSYAARLLGGAYSCAYCARPMS